jgi:cell division protein FtsI (penicillin-binding protein 3)
MKRKTGRNQLTRTHARRCGFLSLLVVIAGATVTARAAQVQLVQSERWKGRATDQTVRRDTLPAARGGIFDRHGRPLAVSREEYDAYFAPAEAQDRAAAVETIVRTVELGARSRARLSREDGGWIPIGRVDGRIRAALEEGVGSGVHFEPVVTRAYPEGSIARSLLGSVDERGRGRTGLEYVLDSLLAGTEGEVVFRRDGRGEVYPARDARARPPRPGRDVYLTIDVQLQEIAEGALSRALEETGASGGDVLMADPRTGELLAVASRRRDGGFGIPAFTDPYEPGSTVKPFLLATLLQEGRASLEDRVYVEHGEWRTPYRTIRDVHGYDTLTVAEVVRYSSNIGAAKLAHRLEPGLQYAWLRDFGFGTPTGVEIPSESAGLLRRPDAWSALSQESLAYGYELLVTSVQLVAAYGALANGGVLLRPEILREVREPEGPVAWRANPYPVRRVTRPEIADEVTAVLGSVVSEEGTGRRAAVATVPIAGKTGTARIASRGGYGDRRYAASFVGFAPAGDARLVILTKLEDPKGGYYGGGTAAPVSRAVIQAILAGEDPDLVDGGELRDEPDGDRVDGLDWRQAAAPRSLGPIEETPFRFASTGAPDVEASLSAELPPGGLVVPDVRGLSVRAAVARIHRAGLRAEVAGSGEVREQEPPPGVAAVRGARVLLR